MKPKQVLLCCTCFLCIAQNKKKSMTLKIPLEEKSTHKKHLDGDPIQLAGNKQKNKDHVNKGMN